MSALISHSPPSPSLDAAAAVAVRSLSSSSWRDQQPFQSEICNAPIGHAFHLVLFLSLPLFLPTSLFLFVPVHLAGRLLVWPHTHRPTHICNSKTGRLRVARKASAHFIYVACCANYDATVDGDGDSDVAICATPSFFCSLSLLLSVPLLQVSTFDYYLKLLLILKNFCLILDLSRPHLLQKNKQKQISQMGAEPKIKSNQIGFIRGGNT